ncbi:MAG: monooxygenase [Nitrospirae bacterium]|nr:monooxygenase [Nitrospirota bacterium]
MKLVQMDFRYTGPFGQEMAEAMQELAESISKEPGFLWKIWTENKENQEAGGIYMFADEESAKKYVAMHTARLKQFGIEQVNAKYFDVNVPLSKIDNGPV